LDYIEFVFGIKYFDNAEVGQRIAFIRHVFIIMQRFYYCNKFYLFYKKYINPDYKTYLKSSKKKLNLGVVIICYLWQHYVNILFINGL